MSIYVTDHAKMRWKQRVNSKAKRVGEEIVTAMLASEFIFTDEDGMRFRLYDVDTILVCADTDTRVVTVFKVNYGFPCGINRKIAREVMNTYHSKEKQYLRIKDKYSRRVASIAAEKEGIDQEAALIEARLAVLAARRSKLQAEEHEMDKKADELKAEMDSLIRPLVYSVDYHVEKLATKSVS